MLLGCGIKESAGKIVPFICPPLTTKGTVLFSAFSNGKRFRDLEKMLQRTVPLLSIKKAIPRVWEPPYISM